MATEKRLIDSRGKFTLNAGDITGHIMCVENGYATVFDRFAKVVCKFSLLDAPTVDAVEVVHGYVLPADDPKHILMDRKCGICDQLMLATDNYCPMCGAKNEGER